ncbi:uncharacterized protein LOC109713630 [Ananas comosus]|uniref:Uncharacterized protein LOC109713630 n=1 Tax=Ananas comosus TaxID=4615 RepID=A0A6P5FIX4_ANACO|nr:uncharacterized protein LOC109713630 [Ananas comosus]
MDRKPPLALSPRRLRPRRATNSIPSVQTTTTPPAATAKKTQIPNRSSVSGISLLQPDYHLISSELQALAKRAKKEESCDAEQQQPVIGGNLTTASVTCNASLLFERGRFYEIYSLRRNERLKRKKAEISEEAIAQDPNVAVELSKKRNAKKAESVRKSVPPDFSVSRVGSLRSSVRSSREMRNLGAAGLAEKSGVIGARMTTRSGRKI